MDDLRDGLMAGSELPSSVCAGHGAGTLTLLVSGKSTATKCLSEAGGDTGKWRECANIVASGGNHTVTSDGTHLEKGRIMIFSSFLVSLLALRYLC